MKLYHQPWSPNCQKVLIAIHELGLEGEVEISHYNPFEGRQDWFLELNPAHKVPVFVDGGTVLWESGAICHHLADKFGRLLPEDAAARSRALTLLYYESCNIAPTIGGEGLFGEMFRPEEERDSAFLARMSGQLAGRLEVLGRLLADGRDYFAGGFSIADVQLYPGLSKVVELPEPASPPALKAWAERVGARPAVQAVYAEVTNAG
ncbi:MAG TPA: glutathione S-transferase family protein [Alphaproteobacteria bacterium]|jgi:glutathione S-transferase|nr:glutathione S-transferase family protein [Alphaproteobacteria bacterium]